MTDSWFMLICLAAVWSWLWLPPLFPEPHPVVIPGPGPFTVQVEGQLDYHTMSWDDALRHATKGGHGGKIILGQ